MDPAAAPIFRRYCGPSVQFERFDQIERKIRITYSIPALGETQHRVFGRLRNGMSSVFYSEVKRMAGDARDHAYVATGHRDADMKHLLGGGRL